MDQADIAILDKTSLFGIFVRRCRLEFSKSSMQQRTESFTIFQHYVMANNASRSMDVDMGSILIKKPSILASKDESKLKQDGWWFSDHFVDRFLTTEAEKIEKTGTSEIPPAVLHKYLNFLQSHAPDIRKIDQVRFLNYIRTGEYQGALTSLHRFFDYCLLSTETPMYQYALLSLGVLEAKFGHAQQALAALDEALDIARENQDENCLNEVLSWIRFIKGNDSSLTDQYPMYSLADESNPNVAYLECLDKLSRAREMIRHGDSANKVLEAIHSSTVQGSLANIDYLNKLEYLTKAIVWNLYGDRVQAKVYLDIALDIEQGDVDSIEKTFVLAADMHAAVGDYEKSIQLLDDFTKKYPDQSVKLLTWKQALCRYKHRLATKTKIHQDLAGQEDLLVYIHPQIPEDRFEALERFAEQKYKEKHPDEACLLLQKCYDVLKKSDHPSQLAQVMIGWGRIDLDRGDVESAMQWLRKALDTSKKASDFDRYFTAAIKLAEAYLEQSKSETAIDMLESMFPQVLAQGSLKLQADLQFAYSKALIEDDQIDTALHYLDKSETAYQQIASDTDIQQVSWLKSFLTSTNTATIAK
ncbi:anaphase-promoting complex subunit 5-domain-containing protein [Phascolomyces articulosus]|uniref:Anaphase-promoting complex subunit 5 n=1 Tax=Phascolomyces articulosus TaxID=60185 RepID=A0AAD5KAP5_9FUNG|nr:anaphase-promoting complex subunit 5-domain-containing protein [Phascolomyces articulosus]